MVWQKNFAHTLNCKTNCGGQHSNCNNDSCNRLGFAVTGRIRPNRLLRKGGLRPGDRLVLTKPLGTGVILAAEMRRLAPARVVSAAIAAMLQPAADASACLAAYGATACTDVTGFGLLGHLLEMLAASKADARLDPDRIPALDGALSLLHQGLTSSLHAGNSAALAALTGEAARAYLASRDEKLRESVQKAVSLSLARGREDTPI